ncbi:MAG: acyltransferase [Bacteroidales bacterium]|nr:acyltransferase [Bacteroidales bacterium]
MDLTIFDDIRPYYDSEISAVIQRVADNPLFPAIVNYLFPEEKVEKYIQEFRKITSTNEFQGQIMHHVIRSIVEKSSSGLSAIGFEKLDDKQKCMFIGNHRDILLDSAILQILLRENALSTSEITFGSNLMTSQFVIDIGKMNKMFKIIRGGNIRDFYRNSMHVSSYMRYAITEKGQSVWIAQRNGRTKNGDDKTEMAVLKMFALSSNKSFIPNLLELNITPLVISYEYEPCDFLKVAELYVSKYQKYVKEPNEDFNSIIQGITQWKGNIEFVVCDTITKEELDACDSLMRNEKFQRLAEIIDQRIYKNYKLWTTNYIAYDMLNKSDVYGKEYTEDQRKAFENYMNEGLEKIEGEYEELKMIFLEIYANPVKNKKL